MEMAWNSDSDKYVQRGKLDSKPVQMLLDTGSTLMGSVQPEQLDTQKKATVHCVHGDCVKYPTAEVQLQVGDWEGSVCVTVAPELPVPVLLGKDVFQETPEALNLALLVETRAQRKREAAQNRGEGEKMASNVEEVPGTNFDNDLFSHSQEQARLTRSQKYKIEQQYRDINCSNETACVENTSEGDEELNREEETNDPPQQVTPPTVLQATPEEIRQWQEQYPTLQAAREAVGKETSSEVQSYRKEGLLYWHWPPKDQSSDGVQAYEQLVLPECCPSVAVKRFSRWLMTSPWLDISG